MGAKGLTAVFVHTVLVFVYRGIPGADRKHCARRTTVQLLQAQESAQGTLTNTLVFHPVNM